MVLHRKDGEEAARRTDKHKSTAMPKGRGQLTRRPVGMRKGGAGSQASKGERVRDRLRLTPSHASPVTRFHALPHRALSSG